MVGFRGLFRTSVALAFAALLSQEPEFARQYAQRLGGAVDEIERGLRTATDEARKLGLSLEASIDRRLASTEPLTLADGRRLAHDRERAGTLRAQYGAIVDGTMIDRLRILVLEPDWEILTATAAIYVPAVPISTEGGITSAIGLAVGWLIAVPLTPFRRRRSARSRRGFDS